MRYHGRYPNFGLRFFHQFDEFPMPEITSLGHVGEMVCDRSRQLISHVHPGFEVCYVVEGHLLRTSSESKYIIHPGEFFVSRPGEMHGGGTDPARPCHYFSMSFDPHRLPSVSRFLDEDSDAPLGCRMEESGRRSTDIRALKAMRVVTGGKGVEGIFRRMLFELENLASSDAYSRSLAAATIQAQIMQIFITLMKCDHSRSIQSNQEMTPIPAIRATFRELKQWLGSRLSNPPTLEEMAGRVGLSRAHFCSAFSNEMGESPVRVLLQLRIDEAARRLAHGRDSVQDVARTLGFHSAEHFSYAFRKQMHFTPSQWRALRRRVK